MIVIYNLFSHRVNVLVLPADVVGEICVVVRGCCCSYMWNIAWDDDVIHQYDDDLDNCDDNDDLDNVDDDDDDSPKELGGVRSGSTSCLFQLPIILALGRSYF